MTSTVEYVRLMRRYQITETPPLRDPFVEEYFRNHLDIETLDRIGLYTRGMYNKALHYRSFLQYKVSSSVDEKHSRRLSSNIYFKTAVELVKQDLECLKGTRLLRPSNFKSIRFTPSAAAGWGYRGKKRDNFKLARRNALRALRGFKVHRNRYRFVPDKAFARSQLGEATNPKIRHVWGRAFHHILIEGLIAQPLYDKLMLNDTPIYIGKDLHKDMPGDVYLNLKERENVYCLDFKCFDSSLPSAAVSIAWDIIESLLVFFDKDDRLVFDFCKQLFQNNPIVMPDGKLYIVRRGLPSGSFFTQLIGSIVNLINIYAAQLYFFGSIQDTKVLGDDSIFTSPHLVCVDHWSDFFSEFGYILNLKKTIITKDYEDVHCLGHNFYGARITRRDFECAQLALYPETPATTIQHTCVRVASLLYDSGFNSFIMYRLYKYLLSNVKSWTDQEDRPCDVRTFNKLFVLS